LSLGHISNNIVVMNDIAMQEVIQSSLRDNLSIKELEVAYMLGIIKIYKRQIEEANWIKLKLQIDKLPNSSICRIKIMVSQHFRWH